MHNVSPTAAPRLSKAQLELRDYLADGQRYLDLIASGVLDGPADPEAPCFLAIKDALRVVRLQGVFTSPEPAALPQATPTAISKALNPVHVAGMDDVLRSTEPRAYDHLAEQQALAGGALSLSTGEVAA